MNYRDHNGRFASLFSSLLLDPNPHPDDIRLAHQIGLVYGLDNSHLF